MAVLPDGGQFHSFVKFYFVDEELESINPLKKKKKKKIGYFNKARIKE